MEIRTVALERDMTSNATASTEALHFAQSSARLWSVTKDDRSALYSPGARGLGVVSWSRLRERPSQKT